MSCRSRVFVVSAPAFDVRLYTMHNQIRKVELPK